MALQSHGIVVERGDVRLAAGQPGGHVATAVVRAHTVVTVDVGGFWYRFLQGSHTHTEVNHRLRLEEPNFSDSHMN